MAHVQVELAVDIDRTDHVMTTSVHLASHDRDRHDIIELEFIVIKLFWCL